MAKAVDRSPVGYRRAEIALNRHYKSAVKRRGNDRLCRSMRYSAAAAPVRAGAMFCSARRGATSRPNRLIFSTVSL